MSISNLVGILLRQLVQLSDICLVVGANEAVCEAFVDPVTMEFRLEGSFATLENGPWHIHMDMDKVHKITFDVKPDTAHNRNQLSYSVRFFDVDGRPLLRAFLMGMYDDAGALRQARHQAYDALLAHADGRDVVVRI